MKRNRPITNPTPQYVVARHLLSPAKIGPQVVYLRDGVAKAKGIRKHWTDKLDEALTKSTCGEWDLEGLFGSADEGYSSPYIIVKPNYNQVPESNDQVIINLLNLLHGKIEDLAEFVHTRLVVTPTHDDFDDDEEKDDYSTQQAPRRIVVAAHSSKRKARSHSPYPTLYLKGFVTGNRTDNFSEPVWTEDVDKAMFSEEQHADMGQILSKMQEMATALNSEFFYGLDPERYKYPQLAHLIQDYAGDWVEGS